MTGFNAKEIAGNDASWCCYPRYAWFDGRPIRIIAPDEAEILVAGWWHPFAYLFNAGMFDSR